LSSHTLQLRAHLHHGFIAVVTSHLMPLQSPLPTIPRARADGTTASAPNCALRSLTARNRRPHRCPRTIPASPALPCPGPAHR
jgi:hypothetical protein